MTKESRMLGFLDLELSTWEMAGELRNGNHDSRLSGILRSFNRKSLISIQTNDVILFFSCSYLMCVVVECPYSTCLLLKYLYTHFLETRCTSLPKFWRKTDRRTKRITLSRKLSHRLLFDPSSENTLLHAILTNPRTSPLRVYTLTCVSH